MQTKTSLRKQLRKHRRSLSARQQREASRRVQRHLQQLRIFQRAARIAAYLPQDGELDPEPMLHGAIKRGKKCFVPSLHRFQHNRLWFLPWRPASPTKLNKYGIPEPQQRRLRIATQHLDIVLVPLVGFDMHGRRLGMGGGYYDRTFANIDRKTRWKRPSLIGIAHAFQQTSQLPYEPWDIRLDAVVTDQDILLFDRKLR